MPTLAHVDLSFIGIFVKTTHTWFFLHCTNTSSFSSCDDALATYKIKDKVT